MEFCHIDSTNQSKPSESPLCTRNVIVPRRASLRSSNRNIEVEKTSSSTCSRPQKKSRATDGGPKMRQEESKMVENSVAQVDIAEMIEADEVGETEKEPLTEAISNVGCSSPSRSFSLKLTEVANMVDDGDDDDDDDEVDSVMDAGSIDGYQVIPEYIPILKKILSKYGDITRNCTILTTKVRLSVLESICGIILDLQGIDISRIKEEFLQSKITLVNEFKNMKVEIEWLDQTLDEMLKARKLLEWSVPLKDRKDNNKIAVENAQRKLDEGEEKIKEIVVKYRSLCDEEIVCKEKLKKAKDESDRIEETIKYAMSKVKPFVNGSLVNQLI